MTYRNGLAERSSGPVRFRSTRERSLWLVGVAAAFAIAWALAQQLGWPVGLRAGLAALAAFAVVLIPELRLRRARADRAAQNIRKLEALTPDGRLQLVRDASLESLRVHEASESVPYVRRDVERLFNAALVARKPVLLVGHSMAGKTRLAAERIKATYPESIILVPASTATLRSLVEDELVTKDLVVWLDDLERFLKGDSGFDSALLARLVDGGAIVVATIRRNELNVYRPTNENRPAQWDLIGRFRQIALDRRLTPHEQALAKDEISDSTILNAIERYGLAEYLGGGPEAIATFDDGKITNPVGYALVRAAVDWRRAGLVRLISFENLQKALPGYLEHRPDVSTSEDAVASGLKWATKLINETVALLGLHESRGNGDSGHVVRSYEAFDYLVDILVDRNIASKNREFPIPIPMWELVEKEASAEEQPDVTRAADRYFVPRPAITAQLAAWLFASPENVPHGVLLTGRDGSGKTTLLFQLGKMWHRLVAAQNVGGKISRPPRNLVPRSMYSALIDEMNADDLRLELCEILGIDPFDSSEMNPDRASRNFAGYLRDALKERDRDYLIALDGLDNALDADAMWELLRAVCSPGPSPTVRIIVASRRRYNSDGWLVIDLDAPSQEELLRSIRRRLMRSPELTQSGDPDLLEDVALQIAERSEGSFLTASLWTDVVISDGVNSFGDFDNRMAEKLLGWLRVRLDLLGEDRPLAVRILKVLSQRALPVTEIDLFEELDESDIVDRSQAAGLLEMLHQSGFLEKSNPGGEAGQSSYSVYDVVRRFFLENPSE
jgi:hypothetical protein